jgi:hypothetical protein
MSEQKESLFEKYVRLRTEAVINDAENCTSYQQEIKRLVERDALDRTQGELAEMIEELEEEQIE